MNRPKHIGDGVYVMDDGHQLWLSVNTHDRPSVALDPGVCLNLLAEMTRVVGIGAIESEVQKMRKSNG